MANPCSICPACHRELDPAGGIVVSLDTNTVAFRGSVVRLAPRQAEVLFVIWQAMPSAARKEAIIAKVWSIDEPEGDTENNLHVHISKLRRRILPIGLKILTTGRKQYILSDWITPTLRATRAA